MASGRLRLQQILQLPIGRRGHRDGPQALGLGQQLQHQLLELLELLEAAGPEHIGPLGQLAVFAHQARVAKHHLGHTRRHHLKKAAARAAGTAKGMTPLETSWLWPLLIEECLLGEQGQEGIQSGAVELGGLELDSGAEQSCAAEESNSLPLAFSCLSLAFSSLSCFIRCS